MTFEWIRNIWTCFPDYCRTMRDFFLSAWLLDFILFLFFNWNFWLIGRDCELMPLYRIHTSEPLYQFQHKQLTIKNYRINLNDLVFMSYLTSYTHTHSLTHTYLVGLGHIDCRSNLNQTSIVYIYDMSAAAAQSDDYFGSFICSYNHFRFWLKSFVRFSNNNHTTEYYSIVINRLIICAPSAFVHVRM